MVMVLVVIIRLVWWGVVLGMELNCFRLKWGLKVVMNFIK